MLGFGSSLSHLVTSCSTNQLTKIHRNKPTSTVARTTREMPRQCGEADDITLNTEGTEVGSWYEVNLGSPAPNTKVRSGAFKTHTSLQQIY